MKQKSGDAQRARYEKTVRNKKKPGCLVCLPVIALVLNIVPYVFFLMVPSPLILFLIGIFPIIGFVVGVVALCCGKKRIGRPGQVISIIAVAWPFVFVATITLLDRVGALMTVM